MEQMITSATPIMNMFKTRDDSRKAKLATETRVNPAKAYALGPPVIALTKM